MDALSDLVAMQRLRLSWSYRDFVDDLEGLEALRAAHAWEGTVEAAVLNLRVELALALQAVGEALLGRLADEGEFDE